MFKMSSLPFAPLTLVCDVLDHHFCRIFRQNDGATKGKRYFECSKKGMFGVFVRPSSVRELLLRRPPRKPQQRSATAAHGTNDISSFRDNFDTGRPHTASGALDHPRRKRTSSFTALRDLAAHTRAEHGGGFAAVKRDLLGPGDRKLRRTDSSPPVARKPFVPKTSSSTQAPDVKVLEKLNAKILEMRNLLEEADKQRQRDLAMIEDLTQRVKDLESE
jgi:hypothetical protein